jgi:hypothetical protein
MLDTAQGRCIHLAYTSTVHAVRYHHDHVLPLFQSYLLLLSLTFHTGSWYELFNCLPSRASSNHF